MGIRVTSIVSIGLIFLAGCTSGTTYGTGKSHEESTLKSMSNIFSISPEEQAEIDYSARPDLVMPADKGVLPTPNSGIEQADGQAWPETPEERIAAIRNAAPEVDERSGNLPTEYLLSEKQGIRNSADVARPDSPSGRAGEEPDFIGAFRQDANGDSVSEEVKRRREQLSYSSGPQRRYLTEPPALYRTPAETAEAGDLGIDSEVIERRKKEQLQAEIDNERGVLNPSLD